MRSPPGSSATSAAALRRREHGAWPELVDESEVEAFALTVHPWAIAAVYENTGFSNGPSGGRNRSEPVPPWDTADGRMTFGFGTFTTGPLRWTCCSFLNSRSASPWSPTKAAIRGTFRRSWRERHTRCARWSGGRSSTRRKAVPAAELESTVTAWAEKIATNAPLVVQEMKRLFRHGLTQDFESHSHHVLMSVVNLFKSDDFKEAVRSFAEKRPPEFQGR